VDFLWRWLIYNESLAINWHASPAGFAVICGCDRGHRDLARASPLEPCLETEEVGPGFTFSRGSTKQEGRVVGRERGHRNGKSGHRQVEPATAQAGDPLAAAEERARGRAARHHDHLRMRQRDVPLEKRKTGCDLVRGRLAVAGR